MSLNISDSTWWSRPDRHDVLYVRTRSAAVNMQLEDYYQQGKRGWLWLLREEGRVATDASAPNAMGIDAYIEGTGISLDKKSPLFRAVDEHKHITDQPLPAELMCFEWSNAGRSTPESHSTCCHTLRATGINAYLENGGVIENDQPIAAHESTRATKLYDRSDDEITLDEVERILI